jgi:hypothetical protein
MIAYLSYCLFTLSTSYLLPACAAVDSPVVSIFFTVRSSIKITEFKLLFLTLLSKLLKSLQLALMLTYEKKEECVVRMGAHVFGAENKPLI